MAPLLQPRVGHLAHRFLLARDYTVLVGNSKTRMPPVSGVTNRSMISGRWFPGSPWSRSRRR